ncbi:metalloregulator ArsR/SmtB family transcription factor [Brachybacterium sp. ACRRE]|uniref:metalloregulator ArsR/SmtB family transcription factor n=1 Tax=Brachybacterium sp. ACRRE TaxID=2918184 RepID=UPI001EF3A0AE|nr:metalloregulator ArsR/SmtB family transcription factor [Brachybacterium sp. ACRRE]MCG7309206.1 metalloregulator ArsR/SmtB family transcription factor [Brachybacterium sp. ACRRE]
MTTAEAVTGPEACAPSATQAIGQEAATTVAGALKALAEPLRLRMLSAIATDPRGESCVCDLAELADVSQPTVSHHLKVLKETGLLLSERRGTWVWYRIAPARRRAVSALLDAFAPAAIADAPEHAEARAQALPDMDDRVTRLGEELADETAGLDRDLVIAIVRESYAGLARSAKLTQHLIPLTERFARQRLADLTRDREAGRPQVLFVCVANAGRSQLAAAIVNRLADGKVIARSAGSTPSVDVHPHVRSLLAEIEGEREASSAFPKPLTDDAVRAADVVITMGCGDVCPIIPGVRYEDWAVGDPALASPEGVEAIRDDIEHRVRTLIAALTN